MKKIFDFIRNNKVLQIALALWFIIGVIVLKQIPYEHFCHDCAAHWDHTKIIVNEHRLPKPGEGWEMHQQPLYYLLASLITPKALNTNISFHVNCVRVLSIVFGAITLVMFSYLLLFLY